MPEMRICMKARRKLCTSQGIFTMNKGLDGQMAEAGGTTR